jgi:microcystin-dependent protein
MSTGFMGEIRMGGWNFAPVGWALCNGIALSVDQNPTLFQLIGTTYGGDGSQTFNLPDLQSRIPIHQGSGGGGNYSLGQNGGAETVTLTVAQMPSHNHPILTNSTGGISTQPNRLAPAGTGKTDLTYSAAGNPTPMGNLLGTYGGNQPHENLMPFQAITFVIALTGVYPSAS